MTVFDTLRWPVSRRAIIEEDLLERLPYYLRIRWWCDLQQKLRARDDMPYRYAGEDAEYMRRWLMSLNDTRIEPHLYSLREAISKWGE